MCERIDVLQWLNGYYDNTTNFTRDEMNVVTDFSLLWNLFESKLSERRRNGDRLSLNYNRLDTIASIIARKANHIHQQNFYEPFIAYFKERYIANNATNQLFDGLRIHRQDIKNLVRDVLLEIEQRQEKVIESLLIIIYRFRNNLFHGEKELHNIHTQYDNFRQANCFLTSVLSINKRTME